MSNQADHQADYIDDSVDLDLLQAIEQQFIERSRRRRKKLLPFDRRKLKGKRLLIEYRNHLQTLPQQFGEKDGCDWHCPGGNCPPCFGWKRRDYEDYLQLLKLDEALDLDLLLEIQQEYVKRIAIEQRKHPLFKGRWMMLEFVRYLQRLPHHFPLKSPDSHAGFDCDIECPEGNCPPCFGWKRSQYERFLKKLRQLNAKDSQRAA
jgi:hypothetical protein